MADLELQLKTNDELPKDNTPKLKESTKGSPLKQVILVSVLVFIPSFYNFRFQFRFRIPVTTFLGFHFSFTYRFSSFSGSIMVLKISF